MRSFYLCGAQSVGKTTLIRELNRRPELASLRIEVIDEVARSLIKQDGIDLNVFQDYRNHQEQFYQFNLKLVSRYLDMARQDRLDDESSDRLKLYDRSGLDAVNYICTYLPHLSHRMLGEAAVQHLIDEYSSSSAFVSFIVMDPQAEFIEHDNVRLPPQLPELQKYTENLKQLLEQRGIPRVDLPERDLDIRVQRVSELLLNRDGNGKELDD
ncbi:hypothetical protein BOX15_Mlig015293g1 [Macrostomum lignano]|uniref:NadR/Ttd14 AAA domain-containing protein n=1 Tax=Macrostomum lignano TaxID=282301 RepID=A0A267H578_9PLAT|nr:hypothetical protein BOX15_Mlig015293g1 [Macrostomum lignano]